MFRNLLSRLFGESPDAAPLAAGDAELAVAALMIRVARADERYAQSEQDAIDLLLGRGARGERDVAERRAAAEMLEAEAPDTVRLTRLIKDRVPIEARGEILERLWAVAGADGARAAEEDAVLRLVSGLLGLSDVDSALARRRTGTA